MHAAVCTLLCITELTSGPDQCRFVPHSPAPIILVIVKKILYGISQSCWKFYLNRWVHVL